MANAAQVASRTNFQFHARPTTKLGTCSRPATNRAAPEKGYSVNARLQADKITKGMTPGGNPRSAWAKMVRTTETSMMGWKPKMDNAQIAVLLINRGRCCFGGDCS